MLSQGYIWSSMLGCFVGAAGSAARGVPDRFLGKATVGETETKSVPKDSAKNEAATAEPTAMDQAS